MLSFDDASPTDTPSPLSTAMEYAEGAEFMYIAPGQAMASALLAMFWLRAAELSGKELHGLSDVGTSRMAID